MSWCERGGAAALVASSLLLAGCESTGIHPLYASHGGNLQAELQAIAVDPIPERLGHYLGDALQTNLNGTGSRVPPRYHLKVVPSQSVQTALIDTVTSRAQAASVITTVSFTLTALHAEEPLLTGTVTSAADYDRSVQRYADISGVRGRWWLGQRARAGARQESGG